MQTPPASPDHVNAFGRESTPAPNICQENGELLIGKYTKKQITNARNTHVPVPAPAPALDSSSTSSSNNNNLNMFHINIHLFGEVKEGLCKRGFSRTTGVSPHVFFVVALTEIVPCVYGSYDSYLQNTIVTASTASDA